MIYARGILGIAVLLGICYAFSKNRKHIDWKLVASGMILQVLIALAVLPAKSPLAVVFSWVSSKFVTLLSFSRDGAAFLFGGLVTDINSFGFIFAFQVLPTIIFFSGLTSVLYYLGILQRVVYGIAWIMSKTMRLSGAESLAAAGNIFLGQTESPLLVRPYLDKMTPSEMMCLMTGGMATIAGGVFAAYIGFLGGDDLEMQRLFARHLLTASIMSAPAAIVAAKMLYPQDKEAKIDRKLIIPRDKIGTNVLDALSTGTTDGLKLAINVGAMLLVFTAFMFMVNAIFAWFGAVTNLNGVIADITNQQYTEFNLQFLLGVLFAPLAWILGVESKDMLLVGQLLGEKTVLNEFFAYTSLGIMKDASAFASERSIVISTYALCGFANFASIGIQIGGIGTLAPHQRQNLVKLGFLSLLGGTIACFLTATIAGMLV